MIPYSFIHEYRSKSIKIFEEGNFWFYAHNDRKIYFPRILGKDYVIESIRVGLMEQDIDLHIGIYRLTQCRLEEIPRFFVGHLIVCMH